MFDNVITALATPMKENGDIDYVSLEKLLDYQFANGIRTVCVLGTTGQAPTIHKERDKVVKLAVAHFHRLGGRVVVGTGTNSTEKTIEETLHAKECGADGALVVTPYYNKPNKSGLLAHFAEVSKCGIPIIVYDIKGRTGRQIEIDEFEYICNLPNVAAVKAASGDINQIRDLMEKVIKPNANHIDVLSGDDGMTLAVRNLGGAGVVSVISNLLPKQVLELAAGDEQMNEKLAPVIAAAFIETNPVPINYMLARAKIIASDFVRLPLGPLAEKSKAVIDQAMRRVAADASFPHMS